MANISIKERILRQLRTTCASVTGAAAAYRWDTGRWYDGSSWVDTLARDSVLLVVESDQVIGEAMGENGPTMKQMAVSVGVKLVRDSDDTEIYDTIIRRWERNIEAGIATNPFVIETSTSVRLAENTRTVNLPPPSTTEGQPEVVPSITVHVDYRHDRDNPAALVGSIAAVTE